MCRILFNIGKSGRGYSGPQEPELVREYSEETQNYIDQQIASILDQRYLHVKELLVCHSELLEYVSKLLQERETLDGKEFADIVKAESHCAELTQSAQSEQPATTEESGTQS